MNLKTAKMSELVAAFNRLNPGRVVVTRFATRAIAERRVELAMQAAVAAASPRLVRISGSKQRGRPVSNFVVRVQEGSKMKINSKSLRRQFIEWLKEQPSSRASLMEIEVKFQRDMRGVIRQLLDAGWLTRSEA